MKKDPGVPNSAPFKEEVLREAEQRRLQVSFIPSAPWRLEGVVEDCVVPDMDPGSSPDKFLLLLLILHFLA